MQSEDLGATWSEPAPIAALGRQAVPGDDELKAGVCDVTPQYHPPTRSVLALGTRRLLQGSTVFQGRPTGKVSRLRCPRCQWHLVGPQDSTVG